MADPALTRSFDRLADIFAPPSATDIYAGTRAASERDKAQRIADFWANRSTLTPEEFDRGAAALGLNPVSSGYAGLRTKERGQDIQSGDNRYNTDVTASTSRANNAADNKTRLDVGMIAPVAEGATRFVPPSIADMYPGVSPTQTGVVKLQPGQTADVPGGARLQGAPKPPTMDEVKAATFQTLPEPVKQAVAAGDLRIEDVIVNGSAVPMTQPQRLAAGAPKVSDTQPQAFNTEKGPVIWDKAQQRYVPAPGVTGGLQSPSAAQGKEGALGPTTANNTEANKRGAEDTTALNTLDLYETLIRQNPGSIGIVGTIRGIGQNAVASAQDLAATFGDKAPEIKAAADVVRAGMQGVAPELFDTAIPEAAFLQGTLAYALARTENPSGEVSRQAYERALQRIQGGGLLANQRSALAQIAAFRKVLQAKQAGTGALRQPGTARTDTGYRPPAGGAPAGPQVIDTPAGPVTIEPVQ